MRWWVCLVAAQLHLAAKGWNSFTGVAQLYTYQELYTDAQYGPDFGYYSTGRILHSDGPADNGEPSRGASQEWFNSYTTLPMSLSPYFAHALCDRLVSMWEAMGRPSPFVLAEFGGGTGMLAPRRASIATAQRPADQRRRDVLRRARDAHADFYAALACYVIGERSIALRSAQSRTAAEFVSARKLATMSADGRQASELRPALEEVLGTRSSVAPVTGFVLSNELLDEFDPVRLRLVWQKGQAPSAERCADCKAYHEAYVLHSVDAPVLAALLAGDGADAAAEAEEIAWEGHNALCGLLRAPHARFAMQVVAEDLSEPERRLCAPALVCCFPFVLAVDQVLQYRYEGLARHELLHRDGVSGIRDLVRQYRHHLQITNGTVPLTKARYRELRRFASARGPETEKALLTGGGARGRGASSGAAGSTAAAPSALPGRIWSHEVFLALSPARCHELEGWLRRSARRLAAAAALREATADIYGGELDPPRTQVHLKLVARPGEAAFVEQAAKLIDEGFMVTMDYGADADALAWQAVIRPNYEGVHIIDARSELRELCTARSTMECPGLQDITTSVDFTEVAVAGAELGGWAVRAYGPISLLELGLVDPSGKVGHLVERSGGVHDLALQAWYTRPEADPWASFKLLVQHRGARGAAWTLGPLGGEWPLQPSPRMFRSPSPCWSRDLTKPPLASLITIAAHSELSSGAWSMYSAEASGATTAMEAAALVDATETEPPEESGAAMAAMTRHFLAILMHAGQPLVDLIEAQHAAQQSAYDDLHLAMLLVDYWMSLSPSIGPADRLAQTRRLAGARRWPELYGEADFERVLGELARLVFVNSTLSAAAERPPYVCMAATAVHGRCCTAPVLAAGRQS